LVAGAEGTGLLAIIEDLLRGDRPHSGQRVELLERGAVQMNRPCGYGTTGRSGGGARKPATRHDDLLAVGDPRSEVDQFDLRLRRRAARSAHRVRDARTVLQPIEPRPPDSTDDVDEQ